MGLRKSARPTLPKAAKFRTKASDLDGRKSDGIRYYYLNQSTTIQQDHFIRSF